MKYLPLHQQARQTRQILWHTLRKHVQTSSRYITTRHMSSHITSPIKTKPSETITSNSTFPRPDIIRLAYTGRDWNQGPFGSAMNQYDSDYIIIATLLNLINRVGPRRFDSFESGGQEPGSTAETGRLPIPLYKQYRDAIKLANQNEALYDVLQTHCPSLTDRVLAALEYAPLVDMDIRSLARGPFANNLIPLTPENLVQWTGALRQYKVRSKQFHYISDLDETWQALVAAQQTNTQVELAFPHSPDEGYMIFIEPKMKKNTERALTLLGHDLLHRISVKRMVAGMTPEEGYETGVAITNAALSNRITEVGLHAHGDVTDAAVAFAYGVQETDIGHKIKRIVLDGIHQGSNIESEDYETFPPIQHIIEELGLPFTDLQHELLKVVTHLSQERSKFYGVCRVRSGFTLEEKVAMGMPDGGGGYTIRALEAEKFATEIEKRILDFCKEYIAQQNDVTQSTAPAASLEKITELAEAFTEKSQEDAEHQLLQHISEESLKAHIWKSIQEHIEKQVEENIAHGVEEHLHTDDPQYLTNKVITNIANALATPEDDRKNTTDAFLITKKVFVQLYIHFRRSFGMPTSVTPGHKQVETGTIINFKNLFGIIVATLLANNIPDAEKATFIGQRTAELPYMQRFYGLPPLIIDGYRKDNLPQVLTEEAMTFICQMHMRYTLQNPFFNALPDTLKETLINCATSQKRVQEALHQAQRSGIISSAQLTEMTQTSHTFPVEYYPHSLVQAAGKRKYSMDAAATDVYERNVKICQDLDKQGYTTLGPEHIHKIALNCLCADPSAVRAIYLGAKRKSPRGQTPDQRQNSLVIFHSEVYRSASGDKQKRLEQAAADGLCSAMGHGDPYLDLSDGEQDAVQEM